MSATEPKSIRDVLKKVIEDLNLGKKIEEASTIACWDEVVGEKISAATEAYRIRGGTLFVATTGPAWAQELSYTKETIIKKINQHLQKEVIKDIRFRTRRMEGKHRAQPGKREREKKNCQDFPARSKVRSGHTKEARSLVKDIGDTRLRKRMERVFVKTRQTQKKEAKE